MQMIKTATKLGLILVTLYLAFTGIWMVLGGIKDVDTAYNFMRLGYTDDLNIDGQIRSLDSSYVSGLSYIKTGAWHLLITCILSVAVGYLYRGSNGRNN